MVLAHLQLQPSWAARSLLASEEPQFVISDVSYFIPLIFPNAALLASNRGFANVASSLLQSNAMVDYQNEQVMNASALVQSSQQGHVDARYNDDDSRANKAGKFAVVSDNHFRALFLFFIFFAN